MGLIFDSSLSKQAILKAIGCVNTPFLLSRSWVDFAIWFGHGTCQIQRCQSLEEACSLGTERTNTVEWTIGLCRPVILWLTLRTICQLIAHLHCRCTHGVQNTPKKHKSTMQWGCEGERDWSLQRQKLTMKWWKVGVGCGVKRVYTPMCVWGN